VIRGKLGFLPNSPGTYTSSPIREGKVNNQVIKFGNRRRVFHGLLTVALLSPPRELGVATGK
jgi:hypothetical protein